MSIQTNFPAIKPTLLLDFANTKQLDPRITFTRASTATFYGTQTAKAEENLLLQSQDFTTTWTNTGTTDTANTSVAPDGTTTADTLTASAGTSAHNIIQTATFLATPTVFSVFAKAGTHPYIQLRFGAPAGSGFCNFDITSGAGAVGTSGSGATGTITNVGSGWYRCSIVVTPTASSTVVAVFLVSSNSAASGESWTTAGTETVILWGAQLEQRSAVSAYTATTTQPITNYIPVLQTAASGVPRFEHNPITFESLGLEIEEQRTNLLLRSEDFSTTWTNQESTEEVNAVIAPDGTLTADKLIPTTANDSHWITQLVTTTAAAHTFSFYAKAAGYSIVQVLNANDATDRINFDLSNGTIGSATSYTGTITAVGNGWYRCTATYTTSAGSSGWARIGIVPSSTSARGAAFAGNGFSGVFLWGAQFELGAFATSYIPTVASQVTRAADAASMTGTNFSSWYNQAEGTMYADWVKNGASNFQAITSISDGTSGNSIILGHGSGAPNNNVRFDVGVGSSSQAQLTIVSPSVVGIAYKTIGAYKVNDFAAVANAGTVLTDTSGTVPVVFQFGIGINPALNGGFLNGTIRKIAYYPIRVSNTNLQALTS